MKQPPCSELPPCSVLNKNHGLVSSVLALTSLALFWAIPFSAILILITLRVVSKNKSWPRQITRWAAALCTLYTIMLAAWILVLTTYFLVAHWRLEAN
jgi:glucan phosphoethanolaminetransferase (alkaline phosphatase superfamily)